MRELDREARLTISRELGHEREAVDGGKEKRGCNSGG